MFGGTTRRFLTYLAIAVVAGCQSQCDRCTRLGITDPVACAQATKQPEPGPEFLVRIWSGDSQIAARGSQVAEPIVVYVTSKDDPKREQYVTFAVQQGGGRLIGPVSSGTTVSGFTDASGMFGLRWELGPSSVAQQVKVTFDNHPNFLVFNALGYSRDARVEISGGDAQTGDAFAELPTRPAVRVSDEGIPIPGMRVRFSPQDGGSPNTGVVSTTLTNGVATMPAAWQLGGAAGAQRLIARVLEGPVSELTADIAGNPMTFTATVTAAGRRVSRNPTNFPDPQEGTAGQPVGRTPSVRVSDLLDRPLAAVSVRFAISSGDGTLGGAVIAHEGLTDANGIITAPNWILGAPGANTVTATVLSGGAPASGVQGNPVMFTAVAAAVPAGLTLTKFAGDNQSAFVESTVAVAPSVRVTDGQGRGVDGIVITWSVTKGAASFEPKTPMTTAQGGYATLMYFGPTVAGPIALSASTTDTRVSPQSVTFTFTGTPRP